MRGRIQLYKWLLALWLLMSCGEGMYAYTPVTPPSAWRTTPTLSADIRPAYQFQSTSAYTPMMNTTVYSPGCSSPSQGPYRVTGSMDDEEEDPDGDPMGTIYTPVGEPYILLIFALLYVILTAIRKVSFFNKKDVSK